MSVVTRFAPSPTGYLHVGGARTAIFSWLLARSRGGKFVLRVEDTDRQRSTPEATQAILDGLSWLGIDHDELFFQSERTDIHNRYVDRLLEEGLAYWCECTPEEVEAMRESARARGEKPKYALKCREQNLGPGEGRVVRLKSPLDGHTSFTDMVKGPISVPNQEMDDLILRRADGSPTYNLAVVADDHEMGVTHVLRGEDHVSNTPRQILIYKALGFEVPVFGHVPMILGPDKKKLSKRHGATNLVDYKHQGYLAEAMFNYLVRLGWSRGDQEIFSVQELREHFDPGHLGTSAAVFDQDKLNWLNAHYIKEADPAHLAGLLAPFIEGKGLAADPERLARLVPMFQPRARTLAEMADQMDFFLIPDQELEYDAKAVKKFLKPEAREHLAGLKDRLAGLEPFDEPAIEAALAAYVEDNDIKFKAVAQPLRVSVTGRTFSPGLHETLAGLGKKSALARLERALALSGEPQA